MTAAEAPPTIPAARYAERLAAARGLVVERDLGGLLVGVGADLRYLTGYAAMPLERLTMLVVSPAGPLTLIVPRLEAPPARACPAAAAGEVEVVTWDETDDAHEIAAGLLRAGHPRRVLVSEQLPAFHLLPLQARLPGVEIGLATEVLRELRMIKDADEVALLTLAAHAADRVVAAIAAGPLVGRTEADVAREVRERLVEEGHDRAAFWIVASGPNSASPHHDPGERTIAAGEPVLLDIGGPLCGYGSDITRVLWVTGGDPGKAPDPEYRALYDVLQGAQAAATAAVAPGVTGEQVDAVARQQIGGAGYGERFIHRTGHGIGLEGHEEPYLVAGNDEPLRPGMAFSIEPGIYLDGRYGARVEDIVVCGSSGPAVLNRQSRDLLVVDG
jgi:Xaa-Pro aminopeptidase